jgi:hypothetical protein
MPLHPKPLYPTLGKHAEGLFLQLDSYSVLVQLSPALGKLKWSEAENAVALG